MKKRGTRLGCCSWQSHCKNCRHFLWAESQSFWRIYRAVTFSAQKKHWCDTIRVYTWGAHQIIDTPKGAYPLTFTAAKVQNVKVHLLYATKRFWSYRGGEKTKWLPRESHPVQKIKINYFIPPPNPRSLRSLRYLTNQTKLQQNFILALYNMFLNHFERLEFM